MPINLHQVVVTGGGTCRHLSRDEVQSSYGCEDWCAHEHLAGAGKDGNSHVCNNSGFDVVGLITSIHTRNLYCRQEGSFVSLILREDIIMKKGNKVRKFYGTKPLLPKDQMMMIKMFEIEDRQQLIDRNMVVQRISTINKR